LSFMKNIGGHPGQGARLYNEAYVEHKFIVKLPNRAYFHLNIITGLK
jgi:hypothetical protein